MPAFTSTITFHNGSCMEKSRVSAIAQHGGDFIVIAAETPFHPRDYQWPDQPEDKGYIENADGKRLDLSDVVCVAISPGGILYVGEEIPVKKNNADWYFCVGHAIAGERPEFTQNDIITLQVDRAHRSALSRAHSAAHLMSLALNRTLSPLWRKEAEWLDPLGAPNFDRVAVAASSISPLRSDDRYRIGKSLRKKGFSSEGLRADIRTYEEEINTQLGLWLQQGSHITQRAEGNGLASYRYWCAEIDNMSVEIPCGGTHPQTFAEIGEITATLDMPDDETLAVVTYVKSSTHARAIL